MPKMIFISVLLAVFSIALLQAEEYTVDQANTFYVEEDWANAAAAYEYLAGIDSTNGDHWFRLGLSLHHLKRYEEAIAAYDRADKLNYAPAITRYNLACAYSLIGRPDTAMILLADAIEAGFINTDQMCSDSDLVALWSDPKFDTLINKADSTARPCEYNPRYDRLDFWLGNWEVFNPRDQKAGENVITKVYSNCMVHENWSSFGSNFRGQSINYYHPEQDVWYQHWNDNSGSIISYKGRWQDSAMFFEGFNVAADGNRVQSRMMLKPLDDGRVEQLIEQSRDGKNWNIWFHGFYVKKGK